MQWGKDDGVAEAIKLGPSAPDLSICDREPIHVPGSIQPHGILLGLAGPDLRCTAISANAAGFGPVASAWLGRPLAELIEAGSAASVAQALTRSTGGLPSAVRIRLPGDAGTRRAFLHGTPDAAILEWELPQPPTELGVLDFLEDYTGATRRLQAATEQPEICTVLADEVRRLTGYDRVKVYRFAQNWNGEVVAEASNGLLPTYLGLHFPATDIPVQARALYTANPERQIPDIGYTPVPLLGTGTLDLSVSMLRSVSPVHIEYLGNMGVGASMSFSILRGGALWGLVACHHHAPHYVPPELRQAGVLLAQLAAWQLGVAEETGMVRRSMGVKAVEALLLQDTTTGQDYRQVLLAHANSLLDLLQASGFALSQGGSITTLGQTPSSEDLAGLLGWLAATGAPCFETNQLAVHYPPAAGWDATAGILAVSLGGVPGNMMVWFRPELAQTVTWGGDPAKPGGGGDPAKPGGDGDPAKPGDPSEQRLSPRLSFAAWTEVVHGQSRPWQRHEVAAANGLRDLIVDIILRRSTELEQVNAQLVRSNEELEAFAYVASHDLKEPLRQIETFGTLLERVFRNRNAVPGDVTRWFDGIQASSRRLRTLINDLADYSRLGRHADPFTPTPLGELLDSVVTDLGRQIDESGARIEAGPLPVLLCDRTQMQQVLQNLVSNAIKYRHPDRPPVITVSAETQDFGQNTPGQTLPMLAIAIADNGIEERFRGRIFEPFQRLHSADEYEGSGIGLAICRKIVERHRGRIVVTGELGGGSTFTVLLPIRSVSGVLPTA